MNGVNMVYLQEENVLESTPNYRAITRELSNRKTAFTEK